MERASFFFFGLSSFIRPSLHDEYWLCAHRPSHSLERVRRDRDARRCGARRRGCWARRGRAHRPRFDLRLGRGRLGGGRRGGSICAGHRDLVSSPGHVHSPVGVLAGPGVRGVCRDDRAHARRASRARAADRIARGRRLPAYVGRRAAPCDGVGHRGTPAHRRRSGGSGPLCYQGRCLRRGARRQSRYYVPHYAPGVVEAIGRCAPVAACRCSRTQVPTRVGEWCPTP